MTDFIHLLPDSIANQIAAGEVVQRPASVVKELMENAVDASGTEIKVIVKEAGKTSIQVIDNGLGMSETDARMSLERHATSKISKTEDLFTLRTMGFRGEALASIAAVAQMSMKTRIQENELGTEIVVEASEVKSQNPDSTPQGTSISIKNLFYNIPARRNFLKSNGVEMRHIVEEFQRVALARPEISFSLFQNDLVSYQLPKGKLTQRIVQLFGKSYQEQLAAVQESTPHLAINGYIGKPESAKKTRGEQFIYVNNRFIKSGYLNHAIMQAYEGLIRSDQFPFYVLMIEIDPAHIDVNVHPTKTEIKFVDERTVYGVMKAAVRQALGAHNLRPSIDFDLDVNFIKKETFETLKDKKYGQFQTHKPNTPEELQRFEKLYDGVLKNEKSGDEKNIELTFQSSANDLLFGQKDLKTSNKESFTFQLHQKYILTQVKSGIMFIDINKAHERILYEKYLKQLETGTNASQQSLFPQTVQLNPTDYALWKDITDEVKALGFDIEDFGGNTVVINGYPMEMFDQDEKQLFEGLIEQYKIFKSELSLPKKERISRSFARRSAIKSGTSLEEHEMHAMIDSLFGSDNPNYSPDGQLIFFILDLNKIEQFFN